MPDAAPDLAVPDPVPGTGAPGEPGGMHTDAWASAGAAMLTGDLVPGAPVLDAPTVDSDADGVADTAVTEVSGELVLATDLDHDARADAVVRIGPDGVVTARTGVPDPDEQPDHPWDAPPPPPPSVDPHTGEWIRG